MENKDFGKIIKSVVDSCGNRQYNKKQNLEKLKKLLIAVEREKRTITVAEIADELEVSKMTVTRYLKELSK